MYYTNFYKCNQLTFANINIKIFCNRELLELAKNHKIVKSFPNQKVCEIYFCKGFETVQSENSKN